ncbi:HAUS augmin-like complex subunit 2 [Periophthalmus magnuspinnatus]|uniref:HAUS augmin-like complex subunit 2 n=1 Tax=Periophthalmus magnuspinnatus TaxID=409849 RepID=UPI00145BFFA7|nr:HAUS augmin-like complex subunit 2 [Periophthalmus magnuspinnatus]
MLQRELSTFSVTPAASVLSRCVSRGALRQEEVDSALSDTSSTFSSNLSRAEERIQAQRELDQLQLQMELLQMDKLNADVTHPFHLMRQFEQLQLFCSHLQDVLRDHTGLRQRLLRPLGWTHLPVPAHLHRYVVEVVRMFLDFIETLELKISFVRHSSSAPEHLMEMSSSLSQLLTLAVEVQTLSSQILTWKEVRSSILSDSSERTVTSEP